MKQYFLILLSTILLPCITSVYAVEPICPGGSQHRSDVIWCADHDQPDHPSCVSGGEIACMAANGHFEGTAYSTFEITKDAPAAGVASISAMAPPGGTGPGYLVMPDQSGSLSASFRYYVKFSDGYLHTAWDRGNHGPGLESNNQGCALRIAVDWFYNGGSYVVQGNCAETFVLENNIKEVQLKNNRWYLIELQATMNTETTGPGAYQGNGVVRAYVDGEKVLEYTNINMRGDNNQILWTGAYTARSYYGLGVPAWSGTISYDNFAYSNTGQYIGPAANENPRGTPDPLSPYLNFASYNGYAGSKLDNDCSSPGAFGYATSEVRWRNTSAASLSTEQAHGKYLNYCAPRLERKPRVLIHALRDGGHLVQDSGQTEALPLEIQGKVFMPRPGSSSSPGVVAGFGDVSVENPTDSGGFKNYLSFGTSGDMWALIRRTNSGSPTVIHTSEMRAHLDVWNDFSFTINRDSTINFSVNGKNLLSSYAPEPSIPWAWGGSSSRVAASMIGVPESVHSPVEDKSLKIHLTSAKDGGGIQFYKPKANMSNAYVIHGWLYLPSSNNYSSPVALSGFSRYGTDSMMAEGFSDWGRYVAVSVSDGKWALVQKNGGSPYVSKTTKTPVQFDRWNEFEIFVDKSSKISLMINREWIIEDYSSSLSWIWDDHSGGVRSIVLGVLDFNGTAPFTAYYDDTDVLSTSAWSCKGWHESSCPFR
jgi:hypothetical protein